jgi:hypothetical protein
MHNAITKYIPILKYKFQYQRTKSNTQEQIVMPNSKPMYVCTYVDTKVNMYPPLYKTKTNQFHTRETIFVPRNTDL